MNNGKEKKRKGTLFKCQVYLALGHNNCGHCKLKFIQIKFIQMQVFEEGESRSTLGKTSRSREEDQQTQPKYDVESGNRTRATLVGGECSHHYATTAAGHTQLD